MTGRALTVAEGSLKGRTVILRSSRPTTILEELEPIADIPFVRCANGRTYQVSPDGGVWDEDDWHQGHIQPKEKK